MPQTRLCDAFMCSISDQGFNYTSEPRHKQHQDSQGAHEVEMSFGYCVSTASSLGFLLSFEPSICTILIYLKYVLKDL